MLQLVMQEDSKIEPKRKQTKIFSCQLYLDNYHIYQLWQILNHQTKSKNLNRKCFIIEQKIIYRAIDSKRKKHEKENNSPKGCKWHHTNSLWVSNKNQAWAMLNNVFNTFTLYFSHMSKCCEYYKTR